MKYILILSLLFFIGCSNKNQTYRVIEKNNKNVFITNENKDNEKKASLDNIGKFKNTKLNYEHMHYFNFHWIHDNDEDIYSIIKLASKYGIMDKNSNIVLPPIYDSISNFYHDYAIIEENGKFGFINKDYEIVIKPIFTKIIETNIDDIAYYKQNNKFGCINSDLDILQKPIFDFVYQFKDDFARIEQNNKWGVIDKNCEVIIKPTLDYIYDIEDGWFKFKTFGNTGFINPDGKIEYSDILKNVTD